MINESYKKRLQQLAGIIKEEVSVNDAGELKGFSAPGQINGEEPF